MPRKLKDKKDRTSLIISVVLHALLIAGVSYWAWRTGQWEKIGRRVLEWVKTEKQEEKKAEAAPVRSQAPPKLPPINQGLPPTTGSGTRRAVAADAPEAAGDTFFQDTRKQAQGPSTSSGTAGPAPANPPAEGSPRSTVLAPSFKPPPATSIKQLLTERAKAAAVVESFGTEQISKSGVSDAGDIVGKIAGSTVADGKFAVVRGLADRYTLSTLNGVDIPSADPNRRAAQLDLFPAQFINRVDVHKTFSPDLPGGFAGGAVNIVTRAFPDRPVFSFNVGTSYNTQASLRNDFPVADQGSLDWAAMDDGTRELPKEAANTNPAGTTSPLPSGIKNSFGSRQFAPTMSDSPLNSTMSMAVGDTVGLLGRRLGFLAGINYKSESQYYDHGRVTKYNGRGFSIDDDAQDVRGLIENMWGSLVTLAYEVSENHELGFNFMYVQTAEDEARRLQGQSATLSTEPGVSYVDKSILHYTERNLHNFQLKGQHRFPELRDIRLDWVGSLSTTTQDEPDHRIFQFFAQPGNPADPTDDFYGPDGPSEPSRPTRIFRNLQEDNASMRLDLTIPLSPYNWLENDLKTGFFASKSEQTYDSRAFDIRATGSHPFLEHGDPNDFLDPANEQFYNYYNFPANFKYTGGQTITASYGMGSFAPWEKLRLVGGARLESTDIEVNTINPTLGGAPSTGSIQQNDILPAVIATFFIRTNLQLRAAWSETVVRPTYREISDATLYDVAMSRVISGNPDLKMSSSANYDLRLEWFPRPGELISVGGFMKRIDSPIEPAAEDVDHSQISYFNYERADVIGFEIELRKNLGTLFTLMDQFSLGFNYAYIHSEVPRTEEQKYNQTQYAGGTSEFRPLYDQPEFIINADLTWDNPASGTIISLNGGVVGRRLVLVGYGSPDEYEEPAPYLDLSISQRFGRFWKAKLFAKNLLDPVFEVTQDWPAGRLPIKQYTKGITIGLSLGADF